MSSSAQLSFHAMGLCVSNATFWGTFQNKEVLAIISATKSAKLSSLLFGYHMVAFPARMELPTALDYLRRLSSSGLNAWALTNSRFVELLACNSHKEGHIQYEFSQPLPCNRYPN